jgi:serine/threonine-protein kinase/endoribonuclease IRE1
LEDFVARTPYIQDSVVTIGSKVSTIFEIDADRGEIIYKHSIPAVLNELDGPVIEGTPSKLTAGTYDSRDNTVVVVRIDYYLSASDLGKHLFNWTRTFFTYQMRNQPNTLDQPSYLQGDNPYIKIGGVQLALPDSSPLNAIVLRDMLPVATRDDADVLKPDRTSRKSPRTDGKSHVALDSTQNQTYDDTVSSSADSEATSKFSKNSYGWLFPVLPLLLVIGYLLNLTSASRSCKQFVIQLIKSFTPDKKPMDSRGRLEGTPNKRRKQRKRDGLVNGHEILSASDKEKSETGRSADTPIKENFILSNNISDGHDGRQIGKLYVSNKEIGRGSNGTVVFEGSYEGRQVAVKRLLRSHNDIAIKETKNLIKSDQDPNIVRLYGCEHDSDFVYISLEKCKCSLADLIQKHSYSEVTSSMNSQISSAEGIDVELWMQDGLPSVQLLKLIGYVNCYTCLPPRWELQSVLC